MKALEGIAERARKPPALPGQILSAALYPFAAFDLAKKAGGTEEQVKHLCITTALRISDKVNLLIEYSMGLTHKLGLIQDTLDHINKLAAEELGDFPPLDVLSELWTRLARADDYEWFKSHRSLLAHMTGFYESSSNVMKETIAALNRVEAELKEFRDEFATPGATMKDYPLEVLIALLRNSGRRLQVGKRGLERVEQRERWQRNDEPKVSIRTVTAT